MYKIGITGCIGSGKSTVSKMFSVIGIPVYNADERAKQIMNEDALLKAQLIDLFGPLTYHLNGELNRPHLAAIVFNNATQLANLNAAVHPAVFRDFDNWYAAQTSSYIVKEAALMFESKSYTHLDEVIMVTAPETLRIARTIQRDGLSEEAVLARMRNQFSEEEKLSRSQYQIINDEEHLLIPQVLELHKRFLTK